MSDNTHIPAQSRFLNSEALQLGFALLMMTAGFVSIAISQICLGAGLAIFLYRWVVLKMRPPRTGLELSAALIALWALLNIPFSTDWTTSVVFYRRFFLFSAIWIIASVITTERRRFLMMAFSLVGALAISGFGIFQMIRETGAIFTGRLDAMSNPMTSGSLLMMAVLLGAGYLLSGGHGRRVQLLVGAILIPILLGMLMTLTRSALLGLLGGLGVMVLMARPRWFLVLAGTGLLFIILISLFGESVIPDQLYGRINKDELTSGRNIVARLEMWRGGWEMVKDRPLLGFGDRSLDTIAPEFYGDEKTVYHGHLHSNFVQMAVIWGIPGLVLGQFFVVWGLVLLVRRWRNHRRLGGEDPALSGWILGVCGVWVGFYLAGFTEWYFGDAESMLIYLAFLGCALAPIRSKEAPSAL
jgi:O-antigen ligase